MAKLIIGKVNFLEGIKTTSKAREYSSSQIESMQRYYREAIKNNLAEVNLILTSGRKEALRIILD